jgi:hypothetical protein
MGSAAAAVLKVSESSKSGRVEGQGSGGGNLESWVGRIGGWRDVASSGCKRDRSGRWRAGMASWRRGRGSGGGSEESGAWGRAAGFGGKWSGRDRTSGVGRRLEQR